MQYAADEVRRDLKYLHPAGPGIPQHCQRQQLRSSTCRPS